jgi:hypothetical protein
MKIFLVILMLSAESGPVSLRIPQENGMDECWKTAYDMVAQAQEKDVVRRRETAFGAGCIFEAPPSERAQK